MKKITFGAFLFFIFLAAACSSGAVVQTQANKPETFAAAKEDGEKTGELQKQLEEIAFAARGRVGMAAVVLETGESVSLKPAEHFPMQSVYKLPIAMAVLRQTGDGKIKLEQKVRVEKSDMVSPGQRSPIRDRHPEGAEISVSELLRLAVSESDGTASDVLMKLAGGADAINKYLNELEIDEIAIANTEKEFAQDWQLQYQNWASPNGAVALLRALHEGRGISQANRTLLLNFMTASPTGPKRLKGLLPAGAAVAHKTGTSGSRDGVTAATNDIGIVTLPNGHHFAIAVFVADSPADEKTREEVIAKIARALWDKWVNRI
jgi:beta-lactamase class A